MTRSRYGAWKTRRRDILKAAAAGGALLPLLRPLEGFAQEDTPRRVLFWFQPNGVIADDWFPAGTGGALGTDISSSLAPLAPWRRRINVIDDVELYSSYHEPLRVAPHDAGCCQLWTNQACEPAKDGVSFTHSGDYDLWSWPLGPSLDQALAELPAVRGSSPVRSLDLGIRVQYSRTNRRMSYAANSTPVAPENNPAAAFERLFGASLLAQPTNAEATRGSASSRRVLDRVYGDIARLRSQLSATDREALERYATALEALEGEIAGSSLTEAETCRAPQDAPDDIVTDFEDDSQIVRIGRKQMRLMAAAFACDMTRVGSIMWMGSEPWNRMSWLPDEGREQEYHLCSHRQLAGFSREQQETWLRQTDHWFASQLAFFLEELDALDPSGELSANTLIVTGNELSHGNAHSRDRMPLMTIGGDWHFQTGLHSRGDQPRRHGDLLAEVGRAMGADIETFGNPEYCNGPALGIT